ncbi:MAG TPA: N-acetylmuramoyl-L-alanine amidase [Verrucomicrobiae bacterium]|nr:N-acetylmuramoyl-L-alanine amidase [Verrucomicrobiae bacterium]
MRVWLGVLLALLPLFAEGGELRDVRVWASPDGTRVVFDLSGATAHSLFSLDGPDRVVIDLVDTQRGAALAAQLEGKGLVKRVRTGPHESGGLRVVLDLESKVKSKSFALQPNENYGYRVVVDLSTEQQLQAAARPAAPPALATVPRGNAATIDKPIVVAIDAGHGGEDPGARGRRGLLEKDVSLALARKLAAQVNREPGFKAMLVRDGDYYVGLKDRIRKAGDAHADLFVSIHANSYKDPSVRGTAVYVLSPKGAKSEHAQMLENRENMSDLIGGAEIDESDDTTAAVLVDIFQTSAMEASHDAGHRLLESMGEVNVLQRPRVQQAAFVVLKSAAFPSVLVETAFLTNASDERLLGDPGYQDRLARSMLAGIKGYFKAYRPSQQVAQGAGSLQPVSMQGSAAR